MEKETYHSGIVEIYQIVKKNEVHHRVESSSGLLSRTEDKRQHCSVITKIKKNPLM